MRNERDVKAEVKKVLNKLGAYWYMPVQTGYGVKGIPDFIVCLNGAFVAIETKFGGNKTSTWQDMQIKKIQESGGVALVIDDSNVSNLQSILLGIDGLSNA